jgi:hypothetical protein
MEHIPCCTAPAEHWGLIPTSRLANRNILIEQNIKKRTGPALCELCCTVRSAVHTVGWLYSLVSVLLAACTVCAVYCWLFVFLATCSNYLLVC